MNQPLLNVQHLSKTFTRRGHSVQAVQDVSFNIHAGETYALVGESGSGKSTTGRTILGLTPASGGRVDFNGQSLLDLSAAGWRSVRKDIQMIFQDPLSTLDPKRTIGYSIEEPLIIHGERDAQRRKKAVAAMLEQVGLQAQDAGRYPQGFSGGQRQRIGIARALALEPEIIIADEAVSALDVSIQAQVLELLGQLKKDLDLSLVFITHDLRVAAKICDRVMVMQKGEVVELGNGNMIFDKPQHPYTKSLIEAIPGRAKEALMTA